MSRFLAVHAGAVLVFLHLPLLTLAVFSFNQSKFTSWESFSLSWYAAALNDRQLIEAAGNSILAAAIAAPIATAAGTLCAYALWKRTSGWVTATLLLTLLTPEIVLGISLLAFFQWVFRYLGGFPGLHTVVLAHILFCLAFVVAIVGGRLRTMDNSLEEAARDLGATEWQAFTRVTLPALTPAVAAAFLLCVTLSIDDYVITSMVAGVDSETLPMVIYAMARRGGNPAVNAISTMVAVAVTALIIIAGRLTRSSA
ncbi:MAG TPA: ABC transporter permease [Bryobacteraceae bacterium]|nr:ABC transporter permease [Bryobacteraceae bacterium]